MNSPLPKSEEKKPAIQRDKLFRDVMSKMFELESTYQNEDETRKMLYKLRCDYGWFEFKNRQEL